MEKNIWLKKNHSFNQGYQDRGIVDKLHPGRLTNAIGTPMSRVGIIQAITDISLVSPVLTIEFVEGMAESA